MSSEHYQSDHRDRQGYAEHDLADDEHIRHVYTEGHDDECRQHCQAPT